MPRTLLTISCPMPHCVNAKTCKYRGGRKALVQFKPSLFLGDHFEIMCRDFVAPDLPIVPHKPPETAKKRHGK